METLIQEHELHQHQLHLLHRQQLLRHQMLRHQLRRLHLYRNRQADKLMLAAAAVSRVSGCAAAVKDWLNMAGKSGCNEGQHKHKVLKHVSCSMVLWMWVKGNLQLF